MNLCSLFRNSGEGLGCGIFLVPSAKTMTAAAWSVKPNWWCFRNDVAKGYGPSTGSGSFHTGCGCWYWPSRSGSGRSTAGHKTKASAGCGTPWRGWEKCNEF